MQMCGVSNDSGGTQALSSSPGNHVRFLRAPCSSEWVGERDISMPSRASTNHCLLDGKDNSL